MKDRMTIVLIGVIVLIFTLSGCTSAKRMAYEGFGRDKWQKPEAVITALDLEPGQHVADLGSGTGYFTFDLADAVGPEGRVYAVDVDAKLVEYLDEQALKKGYSNVTGVLAEYADPRIPGDGVDLIFTSNTFHHIEERPSYFDNAKRYLRPGGRIAVVEHHGRDARWLQRKVIGTHSTPRDQIVMDMEAAGYALVKEPDFLEKQNFLIFAPISKSDEGE